MQVSSCVSVNGNWSPWSSYTECSVTCGSNGTRNRTRACDQPAPKHNGRVCEGTDQETIKCSTLPDCPSRFMCFIRTSAKIFIKYHRFKLYQSCLYSVKLKVDLKFKISMAGILASCKTFSKQLISQLKSLSSVNKTFMVTAMMAKFILLAHQISIYFSRFYYQGFYQAKYLSKAITRISFDLFVVGIFKVTKVTTSKILFGYIINK